MRLLVPLDRHKFLNPSEWSARYTKYTSCIEVLNIQASVCAELNSAALLCLYADIPELSWDLLIFQRLLVDKNYVSISDTFDGSVNQIRLLSRTDRVSFAEDILALTATVLTHKNVIADLVLAGADIKIDIASHRKTILLQNLLCEINRVWHLVDQDYASWLVEKHSDIFQMCGIVFAEFIERRIPQKVHLLLGSDSFYYNCVRPFVIYERTGEFSKGGKDELTATLLLLAKINERPLRHKAYRLMYASLGFLELGGRKDLLSIVAKNFCNAADNDWLLKKTLNFDAPHFLQHESCLQEYKAHKFDISRACTKFLTMKKLEIGS